MFQPPTPHPHPDPHTSVATKELVRNECPNPSSYLGCTSDMDSHENQPPPPSPYSPISAASRKVESNGQPSNLHLYATCYVRCSGHCNPHHHHPSLPAPVTWRTNGQTPPLPPPQKKKSLPTRKVKVPMNSPISTP